MIKKISKILMPLAMVVGIGFSVTTFTSCSALSSTKGLVFKQFGNENDLNGKTNKSISSFTNSKSSMDRIFYGTKGINGGNYVLFLGSDTSISGSEWNNDVYYANFNTTLYHLICGDPSRSGADASFDSPWTTDSDQIYAPMENIKNVPEVSTDDGYHYWNEPSSKDYKTGKNINYINSVSFFSFIDNSPYQYYGKTQLSGEAKYNHYSPFYKWTDEDVATNDKYCTPVSSSTEYKYWKYTHNHNEYARYDQAAVNYRNAVARMHLLMPNVVSETQDQLLGIAWVNGVPSTKTFTTATDAQSLADWLDSIYHKVPRK